MSTGQTEAQVDPRVACFEAILTAMCARHDLSYLVEMSTGFCHQSFSSLHGDETRTSTAFSWEYGKLSDRESTMASIPVLASYFLKKERTTRCCFLLCAEHACSVKNVTRRWKETAKRGSR